MSRSEIELSSDIDVRLIQAMGSDAMIVAAAKVSTSPAVSQELETIENTEGLYGLIRYLAKQQHFSPFEHNVATFFVEAPIFVFREWMRHRTGAYSEMSGRYTELMPKFWVPEAHRALIPIEGYKSARPQFGPATLDQHKVVFDALADSYELAWASYQQLLDRNIAKEVARACLPVATYSRMWCTMNLRNWLHFLSLRTHHPDANVVSYPQAEIAQAADQVESILTERYPLALRAFNEAGRSF